MHRHDVDKRRAEELWQRGEYLGAGREILGLIKPKDRPRWAAAILATLEHWFCSGEMRRLVEIAGDSTKWGDARDCFDGLRSLVLTKEAHSELDLSVLSMAENVAKVIYNESGGPAPFDENSGWRIARDLEAVLGKLPAEDHSTRDRLWRAFWNLEP